MPFTHMGISQKSIVICPKICGDPYPGGSLHMVKSTNTQSLLHPSSKVTKFPAKCNDYSDDVVGVKTGWRQQVIPVKIMIDFYS